MPKEQEFEPQNAYAANDYTYVKDLPENLALAQGDDATDIQIYFGLDPEFSYVWFFERDGEIEEAYGAVSPDLERRCWKLR